MTLIATWTRLDIGPRSADVTERHQVVVREDDDGYSRIHADTLRPLLEAAGYKLESMRGAQAGGMVLGPTEEAAALRSAPLATDQQCTERVDNDRCWATVGHPGPHVPPPF